MTCMMYVLSRDQAPVSYLSDKKQFPLPILDDAKKGQEKSERAREVEVAHLMWSAVAQLVERRTRNRESPGSNPRCYRFEVWAFSFTSRRLSRLSCINEYLAIDSGGNVIE